MEKWFGGGEKIQDNLHAVSNQWNVVYLCFVVVCLLLIYFIVIVSSYSNTALNYEHAVSLLQDLCRQPIPSQAK